MEKNIVAKLSLPQQNYIETIYELCEEHGHAHSKSIAERLNIKMPSVTEALRTLSSLGLINYEVRKAITLTEKGNHIAFMLDCRHTTLASFFREILGCTPERSNEFACSIEHVIDCELNSRIGAFTTYLKDGSEDVRELISGFQKGYEEEISPGEEEGNGLPRQCRCYSTK